MKKFKVFLFLLCASISFAQSKHEKETRISSSEFPEVSHRYFNGIANQVNYLKYFREEKGDRVSFEAKFKLNKLHFSVAFNSEGILEDIEIYIKKKHIPENVLSNINDYLDKNYDKTRHIEIQKKYINNTSKNDKQFIDHILENSEGNNTHYKIITETKTDGQHELREITFSSKGVFEKSRIVTSSSYEHALY